MRLIEVRVQTVHERFHGILQRHQQIRCNDRGVEDEHDLPGTFDNRSHLNGQRMQVAGLVPSEDGERVYPRLVKQQGACTW